MPDDRRPGELRTVAVPEDANLLEQLVASVERIALGLDATYAAVVALDEHARISGAMAEWSLDLNTIRRVRERYATACSTHVTTIAVERETLLGVLLMLDPSALKRP